MRYMKKKAQTPQVDIANLQPSELNALKVVVKEYITRMQNIENEIAGLKESQKDLVEEYKDKLDMKTLSQVLKVLKVESSVAHKNTYDSFYEVLKSDFVNNLVDE